MSQDWKKELQALIDANNHLRSDGKPARHKTRHERAIYLFQFMREIREMGYKVMPSGVGLRHVKAVCEKYEADGIAAATIQTRISFLRFFAKWIGKPGMINDVSEFFKDKNTITRTYQATHDKSWEAADVDKYRIIHEILNDDPYVGYQLLAQDAFGLRCKEAVMLRPFASFANGKLFVIDGTKGGRDRVIPVTGEYQEEVRRMLLEFVGKTNKSLGDPNRSLKANMDRYSNVVRKYGIKKTGPGALGITGHGLRAGFTIREFENRGLVPYIKGGEIGQLPPDEELRIRKEVSMLLGHYRPKVTTAYSGPMTKAGISRMTEAKAKQLSKSIENLVPGNRYLVTLMSGEEVQIQYSRMNKDGERIVLIGQNTDNVSVGIPIENIGKILLA